MSVETSWRLVSSDRRTLQDSLRGMIGATWSHETRIDPRPEDRQALWDGLRGLELVGLTVPTERGGLGGEIADAAVVAAEAGRALLPLSVMESAIVGPHVLGLSGGSPRSVELLDGLMNTSLVTTLHIARGDGSAGGRVDSGRLCLGRQDDSGWRLRGSVSRVAGLSDAQMLLLVLPRPAGPQAMWMLVALETSRLSSSKTSSPGDTFYGDAALDDVDLLLTDDELVGEVARAEVDRAAALLAALHGCEMSAALAELVDETVNYTSQRQQFGKPLAQFQALQHLLADLSTSHYLAETAALGALRGVVDEAANGAVDARQARGFIARTFQDCVESAIQLHGAMGFTWESGLHRHLGLAIRIAGLSGPDY